MRRSLVTMMVLALGSVLFDAATAEAQGVAAKRVLIHMNTSLAEDDAHICAVPNVAWAAVKDGHRVTILVDASAVTSATKGFGWFRSLIGSDSIAWDRAGFPERERQSLSEQMGVPLEPIPHDSGEYFDFLKDKLGVEISGNRTMMLLYNIDPARVAAAVTPIPLDRMVQLFSEADRVIVYRYGRRSYRAAGSYNIPLKT